MEEKSCKYLVLGKSLSFLEDIQDTLKNIPTAPEHLPISL